MPESSKKLSEADVEGTLNKLRAADTDRKVDIVQLFGLQLEDVEELPESTIDPILLLLPPLVRTPHTLLLTSTLTSFLPFFVPLIPTSPTTHLRLAVLQLLPALIERLNDPKDRIHGAASQGVYLLGRRVHEGEQLSASLASSSSATTSAAHGASLGQSTSGKGKEKETLVQSYERQLRDALAGKGWRAKVEIMKVLIKLRAELGSKMGLKSWLGPLVELLEDGDGNVRDQARETVVALLSPTSTPPAARSELKKLLLARNVRKTIADNIIARVFGSPGAGAGRASGTATPSNLAERPIPSSRPSMSGELSAVGSARSGASTPIPLATNDEVEVVYVASPRDLEHEFAAMLPHFAGKETEQNWAAREKNIVRIRGMLKGQAADKYHEAFIVGLKSGIVEGVSKTIISLRTTVAQQSCFLMKEFAESLGSSFDPFVENLLPILGKMAGYTKKIIAERSQACVTAIIVHGTVHPRIFISHIAAGVGEKNIQSRHFCTGHLKTFLDIHGAKSKHVTESAPGLLDQLEGTVKKALVDVNPAVRELARAAFWSYHAVWTSRAGVILNALDGQARKQLEKANPHDTDGASLITPSSVTTASTTKAAPNRRATSTMGALLAEKRRAKAAELAAGRVGQESPRTVSNPVLNSPSLQQGLTRSNSSVSISSRTPRPAHLRAATSPESGDDAPELQDEAAHAQQAAASPSPSPHGAPRLTPKTARDNQDRQSRSQLSTFGQSPPSTKAPPTNRDSPLRQSTISSHHASPLRSPASSSVTSAQPLRTPTLNRKTLPTLSGGHVGLGLQTPGRLEEQWDVNQASDTPSRMSSTPIQGMVDDARKAQAAQAESAAQQLMEYAEEEHISLTNSQAPVTPAKAGANGTSHQLNTPINGNGAGNGSPAHLSPANANGHIYRTPQQLGRKAWEDSPRPETVTPLMVEKLKERKHERSWWVKRQELMDKASPLRPVSSQHPSSSSAIAPDLEALNSGRVELRNLQKLALFSSEYPIEQQANEEAAEDDGREIWVQDRVFERVISGLFEFLSSATSEEREADESEKMTEQALVVLWEMIQHQWSLFDGHEQDLCDTLFKLREQRNIIILESTNALISLLTQVSNPIYLLSIIRASLSKFLSGHPSSTANESADIDRLSLSSSAKDGTDRIRNSGYLFGLTGMGMCVLRLPKAVIEAEGQRLGEVVVEAMTEHLVVRQAAQSLLLAIQCVLRDSSKTLALVPGLTTGQKDLAVYYMAQNGILEFDHSAQPDADADADIGDGQGGAGEETGQTGKSEKVLNDMLGLMARTIK